jgi:peptide/nickel transport system substrate-binding protein
MQRHADSQRDALVDTRWRAYPLRTGPRRPGGGSVSRRSVRIGVAAVALAAALFAMSAPGTGATSPNGGIFRVYIYQGAGLDHVDPALSFSPVGWALIDTFCARLLTYPDRPPPAGFRIVPEVAIAQPQVSRDSRTFTFTLRTDFRFSDGKPVRADAFARAINRTLDPEMHSPGTMHTRDIVGADDVLAGRARSARGVVARGRTLTIRLTHPAPDFPARLTQPYFCAVPPNMPLDPEGERVFAGAGPYHVTAYVPGERVEIRRNRYYRGSRPHHVDGFDVDLRAASVQDMLQRIDRNEYDWGHAPSGTFFDPALGLQQKHGIKGSRFFVAPGLGLRLLVFNSSRPLFRSNPGLRRAINFALDRKALEATGGGPIGGTLTDQYLPFAMPGFVDADVYPLNGPDLARARTLAQGNLRDGKAILLTPEFPLPLATAQLVKRQLEPLGIDVTIDAVPLHIASADYFDRLVSSDAAWDIALVLWTPNLPDAQVYLSLLLTGRLPGSQTLTRLEPADYGRALSKAAAVLSPQGRARAFGQLDAMVARDAAPAAALNVMNEATFVSDRVGCIVPRPVLDLTSVCLLR